MGIFNYKLRSPGAEQPPTVSSGQQHASAPLTGASARIF